jgi:uncharacterized membrane protein
LTGVIAPLAPDDAGKVAYAQSSKKENSNPSVDTKGNTVDPVTRKPVKETSVVSYVNNAYNWSAVFGGLLAVLMIIYAGYRYMTSYGDPEKIADAKDIVEKTLIGLGLLILAALILQTINPGTSKELCTPGKPGCGDIDFNKTNGGKSPREK